MKVRCIIFTSTVQGGFKRFIDVAADLSWSDKLAFCCWFWLLRLEMPCSFDNQGFIQSGKFQEIFYKIKEIWKVFWNFSRITLRPSAFLMMLGGHYDYLFPEFWDYTHTLLVWKNYSLLLAFFFCTTESLLMKLSH